MPLVVTKLRQSGFPYQRTHDAVLAATLRHHGVRVLYTRDTRHFQDAGFEKVIDPIRTRSSKAPGRARCPRRAASLQTQR